MRHVLSVAHFIKLGDPVSGLPDVVHAEVDVADVGHLQRPERFGPGAVVAFPDHRRLGSDVPRPETGSGSIRGRRVERDADEGRVEVEIRILFESKVLNLRVGRLAQLLKDSLNTFKSALRTNLHMKKNSF